MIDVKSIPHGPGLLLVAATLAAALMLAGCAHNAPAGAAADSGSGVTVYGTMDAGVSRTGR